ncbi:hypothetical protein LOTGIDRAFT_170479 [Lottia gigantea]|uniref:Uncharacterized protein n=1 Tax=Lottia gigantea TaxID=225164 RepID=V3YVF1_LOTGI|nr:hypothetical protein LOTGIDRAFT_170479 [Lottia gigantea]ESO81938.1 hypothetical protein LOTGIDRAFT_170479 [Lottia gigantea]
MTRQSGNTTIGCPTILEQQTETINVTFIQTDVVTDYVTQTFETTIVETVSHTVPTTLLSTQQLTVTTTQQLVTTHATTITPSYTVTTVIQPTTVILDGTTIVSTITNIDTTTILSTHHITVTTTELLGTQVVEFITITPSQVVSTVLQPTTVTLAALTVLVTITETPSPIVCPIPTTLTYSVPCTIKNISSVDATICVEQSSVMQSSFGALGFLDPEGVLRTNICHDVIVVTPDESATERAVSSIVNALTVEKSNISAVSNKKISAPDYRPSSTAIGYIGIILFSLPFVFLLAMDGVTLLARVQRFGLIPRQK